MHMLHRIIIFSFFTFFCSGDEYLKTIKSQYDKIIEKYDQNLLKKTNQYFKTSHNLIKRLEANYQKQGDLKNLVEVRKALSQIKGDITNLANVESSHGKVSQIIKTLNAKLNSEYEGFDKNTVILKKNFNQLLKKKIVELTQNNQIDLAILYQKEFKEYKEIDTPTKPKVSVKPEAYNYKDLLDKVDNLSDEEWDKLPGKIFTVSSKAECKTEIKIKEGEKYLAIPNPKDLWNTSPDRWPNVNFLGHLDQKQKAENGLPYMQLCYSTSGALKPIVNNYLITTPGDLVFAPSDKEGGGKLTNNQGSIRVKVYKLN